MRKIFIIGMVLCGFFSSCKEEAKDPRYLHESTKAFFSFQDGSNWEYTLDSKPTQLVEYTSSNYKTGISNPGISQIEFFIYDMTPSVGHKITVRAEAGGNDPVDRIVFINYTDTSLIYSPIIWNDGREFSVSSGSSLDYLDTITINGKLYKDVLHVKPDDTNLHKELFIAKGIGVIERTVNNPSQIFSLEEYNVIQ